MGKKKRSRKVELNVRIDRQGDRIGCWGNGHDVLACHAAGKQGPAIYANPKLRGGSNATNRDASPVIAPTMAFSLHQPLPTDPSSGVIVLFRSVRVPGALISLSEAFHPHIEYFL